MSDNSRLTRSTSSSSRGSGVARDWLFAQFPLTRAASFIRPENRASIRVAERLGATCDGTTLLRGVAFQHWVHQRPA